MGAETWFHRWYVWERGEGSGVWRRVGGYGGWEAALWAAQAQRLRMERLGQPVVVLVRSGDEGRPG